MAFSTLFTSTHVRTFFPTDEKRAAANVLIYKISLFKHLTFIGGNKIVRKRKLQTIRLRWFLDNTKNIIGNTMQLSYCKFINQSLLIVTQTFCFIKWRKTFRNHIIIPIFLFQMLSNQYSFGRLKPIGPKTTRLLQ